MSWNVSYQSRSAFLANQPTYESGTPAPDQLAEARAAAENIINSGAVGGEDKEFLISLFGHANADHEPAPGWANDCVSVSVTQSAAVGAPSPSGS